MAAEYSRYGRRIWMPCKTLYRGFTPSTPTLVTYLIPRVLLLPLAWSENERRETLGTRLRWLLEFPSCFYFWFIFQVPLNDDDNATVYSSSDDFDEFEGVCLQTSYIARPSDKRRRLCSVQCYIFITSASHMRSLKRFWSFFLKSEYEHECVE